MADKKISQLPLGNLVPQTIFPIVTSGITSQTSFADVVDALEPYFSGGTTGSSESNHYVRGWEVEKENGNSITIGLGKGKLLLTNGSNLITGTDGVDFDNQSYFDSPFFYYEATVVLSDGTKRYISLDNNTGSTLGNIDTIYSDNHKNNSLGSIWTGATDEYQYFPYFIPEASGELSHAEGHQTQATNYGSHAEGFRSQANGQYSHAEGFLTKANDVYSHAEGSETIASGNSSHAEGYRSQSHGQNSHAEGQETLALAGSSHAEGSGTQAIGSSSHAEGSDTIASGGYSHAEGQQTIASGYTSHSEGGLTIAGGYASHAEGYQTTAIGDFSHAGGTITTSNGLASFVHGSGSTVNGNYSIVLGRNITGNTADTTYVDNLNIKTVPSGTSVNSLGIDIDGNVVISSDDSIKTYRAIISQSGTSIPTVTVLDSGSLGISWSRSNIGQYLANRSGGFDVTKTFMNINQNLRTSDGSFSLKWIGGPITLETYDSTSSFQDDLLNGVSVEIIVYP